jgi:hypothetical protein
MIASMQTVFMDIQWWALNVAKSHHNPQRARFYEVEQKYNLPVPARIPKA